MRPHLGLSFQDDGNELLTSKVGFLPKPRGAAAVKGREEVPRELRTELPRDPAGPLVGTRPTK